MTIEKRIADALLDLEALIAENIPIDEALATAAEPYDIKVEVLRARASSGGYIDQFVQRVRLSAQRAEIANVIDQAAQELCSPGIDDAQFEDVIKSALGREPTEAELRQANDRRARALRLHQARVLELMLRAGTGRRARLLQIGDGEHE